MNNVPILFWFQNSPPKKRRWGHMPQPPLSITYWIVVLSESSSRTRTTKSEGFTYLSNGIWDIYELNANNGALEVSLCLAISMYSSFNSIPMYCLPFLIATNPVVPAPKNGSKTTPPLGQPASMQGSMRSGGKVAKWASLYGFVDTVQTERLLRVPTSPHVLPENWSFHLSSGTLLYF